MRIKLDENITVEAAALLARFGHDVDSVLQEGLRGATDDVVRGAAARAGRMVVTFDIGFADVRLRGEGEHPGVLLLRLADQQPANVLSVLEELVSNHDLDSYAGSVVVVTERLVRVRHPDSL